MVTTASVRGQVVIPAEIRTKAGIKPGTRFHVHMVDTPTGLEIVLRPITAGLVRRMAGFLHQPGKSTSDELIADRRKEEGLKEKRISGWFKTQKHRSS